MYIKLSNYLNDFNTPIFRGQHSTQGCLQCCPAKIPRRSFVALLPRPSGCLSHFQNSSPWWPPGVELGKRGRSHGARWGEVERLLHHNNAPLTLWSVTSHPASVISCFCSLNKANTSGFSVSRLTLSSTNRSCGNRFVQCVRGGNLRMLKTSSWLWCCMGEEWECDEDTRGNS